MIINGVLNMALIKAKKISQKENIKLELDQEVLSNINKYCKFAEISIECFFEEAALYIFKNDKEWIKHLKPRKK